MGKLLARQESWRRWAVLRFNAFRILPWYTSNLVANTGWLVRACGFGVMVLSSRELFWEAIGNKLRAHAEAFADVSCRVEAASEEQVRLTSIPTRAACLGLYPLCWHSFQHIWPLLLKSIKQQIWPFFANVTSFMLAKHSS